MSETLEEIIPILTKYKQTHLIQFYDELNAIEQEELVKQIKNTNFEFLNQIYINSFKEESLDLNTIEPINYYSKLTMSEKDKEEYIKLGNEIISNGKLAVITLAGGMGSRLGFKGPKGSYEIDVPPKKALFEFLCDKLKKENNKYGIQIPWYIMTSPSNDKQTREFFEKKNYFDYPKNKITFFTQSTMNILDTDGKVMLNDLANLKKDSNGNGDIFKSFENSNLNCTLENIDWISVSGVDNIILEIIDPLLIGLAIKDDSEIAVKSIKKENLESKEWVFARKCGKLEIINPKLLPENIRYSINEKENYKYNQINILSHLFKKEAFFKAENIEIPYHRAFKKTDFINSEGVKVVSKEPNSFKFEKFIFDVFKYFDKYTLLEVEKKMEFAPIKSFSGNETPENALKMYLEKAERKGNFF